VISASEDYTLKVWDLEHGTRLHTLEGHTHEVTKVAITPDGKRVVSASNDNTLRVWDLERGTVLYTLREDFYFSADFYTEWRMVMTPQGGRAISYSNDGPLKVWDLESGTELRTLERNSSGVRAVAITPDGKRVVTASYL
jgi:WD40 repeat protein